MMKEDTGKKCLWGVVIALLLIGVCLYHCLSGGNVREGVFYVFNTTCRVTVYGVEADKWQGAMARIVRELQELHDCLNAYDENSELCRLNAAAQGGDFVCSERLWDVLLAAGRAHQDTDGAYDATVGPLMRLWGFHGKRETVPSQAEIDAALAKVGFSKLALDEKRRSVHFPLEGMSLDFGGIAKGYACDKVASILKELGIGTYMIDLGGNLLMSEDTPRGADSFPVGIRDPQKPGCVIRSLELRGTAVATSGNYERSRMIGGSRVGHIMDPRTGKPGEVWASVTVITPRGVDSDAFSTAVFVGGEQLARKLEECKLNTKFILYRELVPEDTKAVSNN